MAMIDHSMVAPLIPENEVKEIFKNVAEKSLALQLLTRLPDMSSNVLKMRVETALPLIYWQGTATAHKKTGDMAWKNKYIYAEELAVIVPIAQADLDDANYDIYGQIRDKVVEAIANKVDEAVFIGGDDKPATFPKGILDAARDAGHVFAPAQNQGFYSQVSDAMGLIEDDGYEVRGILGGPALKKKFRDMTDTTGQLIHSDEISALPRHIVRNGAWDESKAKFLVGDFKQGVYSIRQELDVKLLTEGVIQDPSDNSIVYNLAQQDMVAFRFTFRFGWQLPNPVNRIQPDEEGRLPFALCIPTASKLVVSINPAVNTSFSDTISVKMAADVYGAKIYYTTDNSTPDTDDTLYTGAISLSANTTVKAIAVKDKYTNSDVKSVTFTKN